MPLKREKVDFGFLLISGTLWTKFYGESTCPFPLSKHVYSVKQFIIEEYLFAVLDASLPQPWELGFIAVLMLRRLLFYVSLYFKES